MDHVVRNSERVCNIIFTLRNATIKTSDKPANYIYKVHHNLDSLVCNKNTDIGEPSSIKDRATDLEYSFRKQG